MIEYTLWMNVATVLGSLRGSVIGVKRKPVVLALRASTTGYFL